MRPTLIATLLAGSVLSLNVHALDLLQVYQEALANDPVYASARASLAAGQEKTTQGRAGLLPVIGLSGGYTNSDINSLAGARNVRTNTHSISLSQPLFRWANWEQYQQGKLSVAISEAQFAQAQQDLIVRVSQAYFDVLGAQDTLASVQAQKVAITEQLASAKRNFEVGTTTITDTHEAQARYDLAEAQELAAQNDLDIKRNALQQIIGKPAGGLGGAAPGRANQCSGSGANREMGRERGTAELWCDRPATGTGNREPRNRQDSRRPFADRRPDRFARPYPPECCYGSRVGRQDQQH